MSIGVSLTDELWSDLYRGTPNIPEPKLTKSEWNWLKQVSEIPSKYCDTTNLLAPALKFELSNEEFWIVLRFVEGFPSSAPIVKCAFQSAFFFDWIGNESSQETTLKRIISQYQEFAQTLNDAIDEIKKIDEGELLMLGGYFLDEEDTELLVVKLTLQTTEGESEQITAKINWRSPNEFPHELHSLNPSRFHEIDCDQWDASQPLSINFARICGLHPDFEEHVRAFRMPAHPNCTVSLSKDVSHSGKELHSIPCKIEYTGPANINGYFLQSKHEDGSKTAAFRGHGLQGRDFPMPEGYELFVLKELPLKGETRRLHVVDKASSFTFWEWDTAPGNNSAPARAFTTLRVAQALAED